MMITKDKVEEVKRLMFVLNHATNRWITRSESDRYIKIRGTAESGAVRRASMDLTRALAELRR